MNHYFFVRNIGSKLAGIEVATKKRLELFTEMNEQTYIATIAYNTILKQCVEKHSIPYEKVVNIYRYYQKLSNPSEPCTLEYLKRKQPEWRFEKLNNINSYRVFAQDGQYIMYLACFENNFVNYMNFFDQNKKKFKRIICDEFGNQSSEVILDANQKVICERYLNHYGHVCIEEHFTVNADNEHTLTNIYLIQDGVFHIFNSQKEFIAHWMSDLADEGKCIFYFDRNRFYAESVPYLRKQVPIYPIIHSVHTKYVKQIMDGPVNKNYVVIFANNSLYEGYVVPTALQKSEMIQRFNWQKPVHVIPVGYKTERPRKLMKDRTKNKIVVPSRFSPEKQLDHVVEVIDIVRKVVPDVQLHFYGFDTSLQNLKGKIVEMIESRQLQQHVFIHDFTTNIFAELDDASAFLLTSKGEGFCLTLLEALSCGVPSFSYDIRYGPSDMIQQGLNGYLIEEGDIPRMAQLLIAYLKDDEKKQRMSNSAYEWANVFDKEIVKSKWQQIISAHK